MMRRTSKSNTLSLGLILLTVAMLTVAGCAPASTAAPATIPTVAAQTTQAASANSSAAPLPDEISVAEAAAKREAGAFILDVRQPDEWNEVHVPGSTLIPLDQLEARLNEVPKDKEVVVICRSGNRSKPGRDTLKAAGFTQVTSVTGGLKDWKAAGLPTATGP
jgi:rhodanese-related sulfurtransferase